MKKLFRITPVRVAALGVALLAFVLAAFAVDFNTFIVNGVIPAYDPKAMLDTYNPFDGGPAVVHMAELTMLRGDLISWHHHTGQVFVVVKSGTVTENDGCGTIERHSAGQAWFEAPNHIHEVYNDHNAPVDLYVTNVHPKSMPGMVRDSGPDCP